MEPNARIARIISARVTKYEDNGETIAYVYWADTSGRTGETLGDPESTHMRALLARAKREGIRVQRSKAGLVPNVGMRRNGAPEDDAREFSRRRNMVGTTVRHMPAGRTFSVVLSNRGSEIGERTDILKRGKVVSSTYYLPPLPAFLRNSR